MYSVRRFLNNPVAAAAKRGVFVSRAAINMPQTPPRFIAAFPTGEAIELLSAAL